MTNINGSLIYSGSFGRNYVGQNAKVTVNITDNGQTQTKSATIYIKELCGSSYQGQCIDAAQCDTTQNDILTGACPNDPSNIKCCVPKSQTQQQCGPTGTEGTCSANNCAEGKQIPGSCPTNQYCCKP